MPKTTIRKYKFFFSGINIDDNEEQEDNLSDVDLA
jgi:hypothetical protein